MCQRQRSEESESFAVERKFDSYAVAKDNIDINTDVVPMALCLMQSIQNHNSSKPLLVLLDSGSSHTWINPVALPKGCTPVVMKQKVRSTTLAGPLESSLQVDLKRVTFPEFFKNRYVDDLKAHVFQAPCRYDAKWVSF